MQTWIKRGNWPQTAHRLLRETDLATGTYSILRWNDRIIFQWCGNTEGGVTVLTKGVFPWGKEHESDWKEERFSSQETGWAWGLWTASSVTVLSQPWVRVGECQGCGMGAATGQGLSLLNCQIRCRRTFLQKNSQFAACGPLGDHRIITRAPWIHSKLNSLR